MTEKGVPEIVPESERGAFSTLPPQSQQVLLSHYRKLTNVLEGEKTGTTQTPENATETLRFSLTLEEKQSIEDDINAGKPIMATPAYLKFLSELLPNGLRKEDENGVLIFSKFTPEYEISNGVVRANHRGSISIIELGLSDLLDKRVQFSNADSLEYKFLRNGHFEGCRDAYGKLVGKDIAGISWVIGGTSRNSFKVGVIWMPGADTSDVVIEVNAGAGLSLFPSFFVPEKEAPLFRAFDAYTGEELKCIPK